MSIPTIPLVKLNCLNCNGFKPPNYCMVVNMGINSKPDEHYCFLIFEHYKGENAPEKDDLPW